tara:strand:- start:5221 stop:5856 length:636 start_codon:yes stop_codon:yes gene_type:complete
MKARSLRELTPLDVQLEDGLAVRLRPIQPGDTERVQRALALLSESSFRKRFSQISANHDLAEYLSNTANEQQVTWLAMDAQNQDAPGFGGASLWLDLEADRQAEASFTVADAWHRKGFATLLFSILWIEGWNLGLRRIVGYARPSNAAIQGWWTALGGTVSHSPSLVQMNFEMVSPEEVIQKVGYDLHASPRQYEFADWLQHWMNLLDEAS